MTRKRGAVTVLIALAAAVVVVVFIFDWSFCRRCGGRVGGIVVEGGLHYLSGGRKSIVPL